MLNDNDHRKEVTVAAEAQDLFERMGIATFEDRQRFVSLAQVGSTDCEQSSQWELRVSDSDRPI